MRRHLIVTSDVCVHVRVRARTHTHTQSHPCTLHVQAKESEELECNSVVLLARLMT